MPGRDLMVRRISSTHDTRLVVQRAAPRTLPVLLCLLLAAAVLPEPQAEAQGMTVDCMASPPRQQDLTLVAAYAASPPAVDEVAFTMEVENLMALTYGGDLLQYKPIWYPEAGVCGAGVNLPGDQAVIGRWAESWTSSSDGTVWTFKLKKGVKSFAGNEMTCDDHRWSWQRGYEMKGVKFFFAQVMGLTSPEDVTCPDKYTIRFKLKAFNPLLLQMLAMNYYGGPFDSVEAKKRARPTDPWAKEWLKNNTAGFGPYQLVRHIPGQELELVRNPHYKPRPAVSRILIKIIPDSATRFALLKRGAVDYAMRLREREYQEVVKDPNLQVVRHPANFIPYFGPVQTNPVMANVKVRQALAYAIPYEEIHQKVYSGQGHLIKSITPRIYPNYTDKFWVYKTDLEKAKTLLAEAGYPNGFEMTISYDKAIAEMEESCILIKSTFEKIGLKVRLEGLPSAVYSETKFSRKQMAHCDNFQWPWVADTGYTTWLYLTHPKTNVMDAVGHDDPELNELTEKMLRTPFGPERLRLDLRVQQLAAERVPWIFLVNPGWREAFKKGWTGFHWYPDNNVHFDWLYQR
jgi:peptide/nickel transport system substrate-binding protein